MLEINAIIITALWDVSLHKQLKFVVLMNMEATNDNLVSILILHYPSVYVRATSLTNNDIQCLELKIGLWSFLYKSPLAFGFELHIQRLILQPLSAGNQWGRFIFEVEILELLMNKLVLPFDCKYKLHFMLNLNLTQQLISDNSVFPFIGCYVFFTKNE